MKRYNLTVVLQADVVISAVSVREAKQAIQRIFCNLQVESMPDFVIQDAEVTGVYDTDWNEIDATD